MHTRATESACAMKRARAILSKIERERERDKDERERLRERLIENGGGGAESEMDISRKCGTQSSRVA